MRCLHVLRPYCAGDLNDLHEFDPASGAWTDLSAALSGTPPVSRDSHGFTSAGGKLYVHGGYSYDAEGNGDGDCERQEGRGASKEHIHTWA